MSQDQEQRQAVALLHAAAAVGVLALSALGAPARALRELSGSITGSSPLASSSQLDALLTAGATLLVGALTALLVLLALLVDAARLPGAAGRLLGRTAVALAPLPARRLVAAAAGVALAVGGAGPALAAGSPDGPATTAARAGAPVAPGLAVAAAGGPASAVVLDHPWTAPGAAAETDAPLDGAHALHPGSGTTGATDPASASAGAYPGHAAAEGSAAAPTAPADEVHPGPGRERAGGVSSSAVARPTEPVTQDAARDAAPDAAPGAAPGAPQTPRRTAAARPLPRAASTEHRAAGPAAPAGDSAPASVVVAPGDSLWSLARADLAAQRPGAPVADAVVAQAWPAWWSANREVVGDDPDLLLPGTRLVPPAA